MESSLGSYAGASKSKRSYNIYGLVLGFVVFTFISNYEGALMDIEKLDYDHHYRIVHH
jgi:hypothetical protein